MRDLGTSTRTREIWITQGHLWALALMMFFIGVLAFFVGLLFGRSQAAVAHSDEAGKALVSQDVEADALDELLARLEALEVEDPQDGALSFPGTLATGEVFPVPDAPAEELVEQAVIPPGRGEPEPPDEGPTSGDVPHSGWAIQVASLLSVEEAEEILAELDEHGIDAYRQAAVVKGETRHRVRIGGYGSKAAAERGRDELADRLGIPGAFIVPAP
jgi:cell division septation protein DedD